MNGLYIVRYSGGAQTPSMGLAEARRVAVARALQFVCEAEIIGIGPEHGFREVVRPPVRVGYWRQREGAPDPPWNKDSTLALPWPEENSLRLPPETVHKVVLYLTRGKEHAAWMGMSRCRICNKSNGSRCLTDGEFVWPEGYAHYITEHHVQPDAKLLAKILTTPDS